MVRLGSNTLAPEDVWVVKGPNGYILEDEYDGSGPLHAKAFTDFAEAARTAAAEAARVYESDLAKYAVTNEKPPATRCYEVVWTTVKRAELKVITDFVGWDVTEG